MALRFNFKDLNANVVSTNGIISNVVGAIDSAASYMSVINAYQTQIYNYNQNKSVLNDAIGMIDQIVSELTSVNEFIDNVIINGEKYDKDKLEDIISRLGTLRSNFESFVTNCNTEIERLENLLASVKRPGEEL